MSFPLDGWFDSSLAMHLTYTYRFVDDVWRQHEEQKLLWETNFLSGCKQQAQQSVKPTKGKNFSCQMLLRKDYAKKSAKTDSAFRSFKRNLFTFKWIIFSFSIQTPLDHPITRFVSIFSLISLQSTMILKIYY